MAWVPPGGFDAPHASSMCAPASQSLVYSSKQGVSEGLQGFFRRSEREWLEGLHACISRHLRPHRPTTLPPSLLLPM